MKKKVSQKLLGQKKSKEKIPDCLIFKDKIQKTSQSLQKSHDLGIKSQGLQLCLKFIQIIILRTTQKHYHIRHIFNHLTMKVLNILKRSLCERSYNNIYVDFLAGKYDAKNQFQKNTLKNYKTSTFFVLFTKRVGEF